MKTAVLVPSHIYYTDQLIRLDKCLESLSSQTIVPDIFVSISFANDTYKYDFSTLLRKYPNVKFKLSTQQKFQMEHLSILSLFVNEYDMLMFCDDDVTNLPIRVEKFIEAFEYLKEHCDKNVIHFGGVREIGNHKKLNDRPEYWAYGIPPSLLKEFFNRIKGYEDLMRYKFSDMYLRTYLGSTGGESIVFVAVVPTDDRTTMYQYTIDNPNSICAQVRKPYKVKRTNNINSINNTIAVIRDNLTLSLISNGIDLLKKQLSCASIPFNKLNDIVPDAERIKNLTKILYK